MQPSIVPGFEYRFSAERDASGRIITPIQEIPRNNWGENAFDSECWAITTDGYRYIHDTRQFIVREDVFRERRRLNGDIV